ncbi:hypothetical protein B4P00_22120 [Shewanella xiamenensis]|jgi:hypothetical protein|uniref:hypothetical protein n=1 Tax=Shewanella xiamenensis TaxID=332186 RepID=UPI000849710B|nr:hypothetical protein [Shewanella xiamenensis]MBW0298864.1 hypothetical protein [Shewanella xiamenensis]ODR83804.1 hypothetical protein ABT47_23910 [Shewanella xiamenensis]
MQSKIETHLADLKGLLEGTVKPRTIIGTGYNNPKSAASAWLRMQLHNIENPNSKIHYVCVTSSGKAYESESKAMKSKAYQTLVGGTFNAINNASVKDFGVIPSRFGDGYEVYACLS